MRHRLASAALAVGLLGGAATPALLVAPVAAAHSVLLEVSPADGATVESSPGQVSLTFNEEINQSFASVAVTAGGDRTPRTVGDPVVDGPTVTAEVEDLEPGTYTVGYRVTSADGHVVSGSSTFTVGGSSGPGDDETPATSRSGAPATNGSGQSPAATAGAGDPTSAADTTAADADAAAGDDSGVNPAVWIVGGLAVVLVGGAIVLLRRGS